MKTENFRKIVVSFLTMVCVLCGVVTGAKMGKAGKQVAREFSKKITKKVECEYLLYLPDDYGKDAKKRWPLMMFLHGAGERGNNIRQVAKHGLPKMIAQGKNFEFIIVSPQCPNDIWWPEENDILISLLDEIEKKYRVDTDRVYLTGLSMGGFGTWSLACQYPKRFAAIAPICGGGERHAAGRLKNIPVWAFHGAKDKVVPVEKSKEMVAAVRKAGGDAKLTVYPEANHDSWTQTYNNPEFYEWFLSHKKGEKK